MFTSWMFSYVILPMLIFSARILDVSIGTLRIIFLAKRKKFLVPILGFFEVSIWLIAMGQIMQNLTNVLYYVAYAGGFAMGNFVGICIEEKLAIGTLIIRIITQDADTKLIESLKAGGFGVTKIDAEGSMGSVKIIFTIIKRKDKKRALELINRINPNSFYTIDDVNMSRIEPYTLKETQHKWNYFRLLFLRRKKEK